MSHPVVYWYWCLISSGVDLSSGLLGTCFGSDRDSLTHLAVVTPQVKVDPLGGGPVPPAVAGREGHAHHPPPVPRGEPALLEIPPPTHRLVLLALGYAALPGEAEDVGVAAEDGTMFHGGQHPD